TLAATAVYLFAPAIARVTFGGMKDVALVRIAGMVLAFEGLLLVPFAYLRLRDQSMVYVAVNVARLIVQVALNVVFVVYMRLGAMGVLLSTLTANILTGSVLTVYLMRGVGLWF